MKTLLLTRHAKSSWDDPALPDFDRPLNKRGKHDAPRMGKWLAKQDIIPSRIISSPARRARNTAKVFAKALAFPVEKIRYEDSLYGADCQQLLMLIRQISDHHDRILLVGHNPGITDAVNNLTDADVANVPTCGVAVIEFTANSWEEVTGKSGELQAFYIPKQLPSDA